MKEMTCIVCPNGCRLRIGGTEGSWAVEGGLCPRGRDFAVKELKNPLRSLCTTVRTVYGGMPRLPVRTDGEIPLGRIFEAMEAINRFELDHPVHGGDVVIENISGLGVNIVAASDLFDFLEGRHDG